MGGEASKTWVFLGNDFPGYSELSSPRVQKSEDTLQKIRMSKNQEILRRKLLRMTSLRTSRR